MRVLILPAAGSGERFGGPLPKQIQDIAGLPMLAYSLRAFAPFVDACIIPTRPDLMPIIEPLAQRYGPADCRIINGGPTRMASVAAAVAALPDNCIHLLVHDAARPCIHADDIRACLQALAEHRCCLLARPCRDTVKRAADRMVTETIPRDELWLAETPQCFEAEAARRAFAQAERDDTIHTDDVAVLAAIGIDAYLVSAGHPNPKLTSPNDEIVIAALLAAAERDT